jgi:cytoskeletal protein RodZ
MLRITGDLSHVLQSSWNSSETHVIKFTSLTTISVTVANGGRDDHGEHNKGEKNTFSLENNQSWTIQISRNTDGWIRRFEDVTSF